MSDVQFETIAFWPVGHVLDVMEANGVNRRTARRWLDQSRAITSNPVGHGVVTRSRLEENLIWVLEALRRQHVNR